MSELGDVAIDGAPTSAVIFDMDGVLVLTERPHWESWLVAAGPRGVTFSYEKFLSCFGRINPDCIRILFGEMSPEESAMIAEEKEAAFREIIRDSVPLAPGVVELLEELRGAGVRTAVGSSGPPENVKLVVENGGLATLFDGLVDGSMVRQGKPAPDCFLLAAEKVGVEPGRCVVVEDAPAGIRAARAAGMVAVALTTTNPREALVEAGAHHVFESIQAIRGGVLRGLIPSGH